MNYKCFLTKPKWFRNFMKMIRRMEHSNTFLRVFKEVDETIISNVHSELTGYVNQQSNIVTSFSDLNIINV
jgi:hypothetical protein